MATAEELLAGELVDNDIWFEVDLLSRQITIPPSITNLGAKSDSDFMRAKFKLPRHYYDIDFAEFKFGIDYTNANGEEDRYEPDDVSVGDDAITFTWIVGRHAALYAGNITFGICAKRLNPEDPDNPVNEFHSAKASLPILDAMETCEEAIINYTDILEQWRDELFKSVAAGSAVELEDARKGFDGTTYGSLGDAIRAQATRVEIAPNTEVGENLFTADGWAPLAETEIINKHDNGFSIVHNKDFGKYAYQITESAIEPHVGYYMNGDYTKLVDEVPEEAKYLTDAVYDVACNVKGEGDWESGPDMIPAAVLELSAPAFINGVELVCRPHDHAPTSFEIQVRDTVGAWHTVKTVAVADGLFWEKGTEKFEFDPIFSDCVRVLIYEVYGDEYPKILEILLYEVKTGKVLEKVQPLSVETTTEHGGGDPITCLIDGDRNTNYQTFNFFPSSYTFNFEPNTAISCIRVPAFSNIAYTPKKLIVEGFIDNEWVDLFGSAKPNEETGKKYTSVQIYTANEITDTFALDFEELPVVSAIRMYASSAISGNVMALTEVEFYGPAQSTTNETSIGVKYDNEADSITQKKGDVWYFGVSAKCENFAKNSRPTVVLEADVNGVHQELYSCVAASEQLEDYYCTFTVPKDYDGSFTNMNVRIEYSNPEYVAGKSCELSDFTLVNLTETYGAGNEPVADAYYKTLKAPKMSIITEENVTEYPLSDGLRGAPGKTAYESAVEAGYVGTEEEFVKNLASNVEIKPYVDHKSMLDDDKWEALTECEIVSHKNGVFDIVHNGYYGEYLEQIKESTITPHVGYWNDWETEWGLTDEVPEEAKYLTDACFSSAAYVHGSTPLAERPKGYEPAFILSLDRPTVVGALEITCRMSAGVGVDVPTGIWIDLREEDGSWLRNYIEDYENHFVGDHGTVRYDIDYKRRITDVRVVISDWEGERPAILEAALYERKIGKVLYKRDILDITSTAVPATGESIDAIIDESKYSAFQTYTSGPVFTFDLADRESDPVKISRLKISAWNNQTNSPKNIIVDVLTKNKWVNVYGKAPCYAVGLKDTFVLDFDKDYDAYALRLKVTSPIGSNVIILNDVEIFGPPAEPEHYNEHVGIDYKDPNTKLVQKPQEVWFFGAKVACKNYNQGALPDVFLGLTANGNAQYVKIEYPNGTAQRAYGFTFKNTYGYDRPVDNIQVSVYQQDRTGLLNTKHKISDIKLVNLTEIYGAGNEPTAEDYIRWNNTYEVSVNTPDGPKTYSITSEQDNCSVNSVNGKTGDVELNAVLYDWQSLTDSQKDQARANIGAAPAGYGFGETYARYPDGNDLDNATTTGVYCVNRYTLHSPNDNTLLVLTLADGSNRYQMAYIYRSANMYIRYYYGVERYWSGWAEISTSTVHYTVQSLTEAQKAQARANIGAISADDIPTTLPNPNTLTIKNGDETIAYDGSESTTVTIPTTATIPTTLPNPNTLTIKNGDETIAYDGSESKTVTIPKPPSTLYYRPNGLYFIDRTTGKAYDVYVDNGELVLKYTGSEWSD